MSGLSDLKARAAAHEAAGRYPEALEALRDCVQHLEGSPDFLRELPLLVRVGDLEARLGRIERAIASYQRAADAYIRNGRAESVVATALRIARLRPEAPPVLDYPLRMIAAGHVEGARLVLFEYMRRTGHGTEADELAALDGAPPGEIVTALERMVGRDRPAKGRAMSLEDAIAEMRRTSGLTTRPHEIDESLPPPPPLARRRRVRPAVIVLMAAMSLGGAGVAFMMGRERLVAVPVALEGPAPSPVAAPEVAASPAPIPPPALETPSVDPPVSRPLEPARPAAGVGLLTADAGSAPMVQAPPGREEPVSSAAVPSPDVPQLPAGAVVTRAVVAVRGLPISRIDNAGGGYRLTQPLPDGRLVQLTLSPFPGQGASAPRVTAMPPAGAVGTMRFGGFMVNARAPMPPDSLHALLLRLVEVPPRQ